MQTTLLKPKAIQVEPLGGNRAKATLEPFERGYFWGSDVESGGDVDDVNIDTQLPRLKHLPKMMALRALLNES